MEGPPDWTSCVCGKEPSKVPADACQEAVWSPGASAFSRKTDAPVKCGVKTLVAMAPLVPFPSCSKGRAFEPVRPSGLLSGQLADWQLQGLQCSLFHGRSGQVASLRAALQQFFAFGLLKVFIGSARTGELGA